MTALAIYKEESLFKERRKIVETIVRKSRDKEEITPDFLKELSVPLSMDMALTMYGTIDTYVKHFPKSTTDNIIKYMLEYTRNNVVHPDIRILVEQNRTASEIADAVYMKHKDMEWLIWIVKSFDVMKLS